MSVLQIKPIRAITRVDIHPENGVLVTHVKSNLAASIVTRYLGVTFSFTEFTDDFGGKELDHRITSDIEPENLGGKITLEGSNIKTELFMVR